mmetsp:Transcript_41523/g.163404  ORF Transcript_41523/g.163404 Transcript_41523/m.163404 type:complete len:84 (-) Transcript_41523:648-899(-)
MLFGRPISGLCSRSFLLLPLAFVFMKCFPQLLHLVTDFRKFPLQMLIQLRKRQGKYGDRYRKPSRIPGWGGFFEVVRLLFAAR